MSDVYETMILISRAIQSNLPLPEAIRISVVNENNRDGRALLRLADRLDEGVEIPQAARQAGLSSHLVALIDAATESGNFSNYFAELAETERCRTETIRSVMNLLSYPMLLFVMMFIAGFIAMVVLPQFEVLFRDFDTELPAMTAILIEIGRVVRSPGFWFSLGIILFLLIVVQKVVFPAFWYYFPVIGRIFWTLAAQQLLRQLLMSVNRKIPLDEALRISAKSYWNRAFRQDCLRASELSKAGTRFSMLVTMFPLLFPRWLVPLVKNAEQSDQLPRILGRGIRILEEDRNGAGLLFGTVLIPIVCVFFASFAFFFVIALFMPLIKLVTTLSS